MLHPACHKKNGDRYKENVGICFIIFWGLERGGGGVVSDIEFPPHLALQYIGYISVGLETYLTILGTLGVRLFKLLFVTQIYREWGVQV